MKKLLIGALAIGLLTTTTGIKPARAQEEKPKVIRVGSGVSGNLGKPYVTGFFGILQQQGLLEEEFKKDGIKIEWSFFKQGATAITEAFANDSLDIGYPGIGPPIIAKATGLKIKILANDLESKFAIAVAADSSITINDLKGKKVGLSKSRGEYLFFTEYLEKNGLSLKDVELSNITGGDATAALLANRIDVIVPSSVSGLYDLQSQGVVKFIYTTTDNDTHIWRYKGALIAQEKFINKYPDITRRVVKQFVKATYWGSLDENRTALFQLWSKTGTSAEAYKQTFAGVPGKRICNPLLDESLYEHIRRLKEFYLRKEVGIIRNDFDVKDLFDGNFLEAALKELKLENYWTPRDAQGKEIKK